MWELGHKANPKIPSPLQVFFLAQDLRGEHKYVVSICGLYFLYDVEQKS